MTIVQEVTGWLLAQITGDAEFWCFLCFSDGYAFEQTVVGEIHFTPTSP